jgi:hypothetical protein
MQDYYFLITNFITTKELRKRNLKLKMRTNVINSIREEILITTLTLIKEVLSQEVSTFSKETKVFSSFSKLERVSATGWTP